MTHLRDCLASSALVVPLIAALACTTDPAGGDAHARAAPRWRARSVPSARSAWFAAASAEGDVVVADGQTGAIVAVTPSDGREIRDVTVDPSDSAIVASEFDDAESGAIVRIPFASEPPALGAREIVSEIDGDLRLLATAAGTATFDVTWAGWRWRWEAVSGANGSAALPPPTSLWMTETSTSAARFEALTWSDPSGAPRLVRESAVADDSGLAIAPQTLSLPAGDAPNARLVAALSPIEARLVSSEGGVVAVRDVSGASVSAATVAPGAPSAARIEAAAALGRGQVVVALTNGPPRLVAIAFGASGSVRGGSAVDLPGAVAVADRFFSRDLLVVGDARVLVATSVGVVAADVAADGSLGIDRAFDGVSLRGPLAVMP